jgi:hypothetical protein
MVSDDAGFQYTYAFWTASLCILLVIFLVHAYFVRKYIPKPQIKAGFKFSSPAFSALSDTITALWNLCFGDGEGRTVPKRRLPGVNFGFNLGMKDGRENSMEAEMGSAYTSKSGLKPARFSLHEDF